MASTSTSAKAATVDVRLPVALVKLFPGAERQLQLTAATVADVVDQLDQRWPGMGDRLRDSRPAIRRHINIFVAGQRAQLDSTLAPGTEVVIMTAISGG